MGQGVAYKGAHAPLDGAVAFRGRKDGGKETTETCELIMADPWKAELALGGFEKPRLSVDPVSNADGHP